MEPQGIVPMDVSKEEHYVQLLLDAMKESQCVENGWKPQVYSEAPRLSSSYPYSIDDDSTVRNSETYPFSSSGVLSVGLLIIGALTCGFDICGTKKYFEQTCHSISARKPLLPSTQSLNFTT
jgi:hypothetical protein